MYKPTITLMIRTIRVNRVTSTRVGQVTLSSSSLVSLIYVIGENIYVSLKKLFPRGEMLGNFTRCALTCKEEIGTIWTVDNRK